MKVYLVEIHRISGVKTAIVVANNGNEALKCFAERLGIDDLYKFHTYYEAISELSYTGNVNKPHVIRY